MLSFGRDRTCRHLKALQKGEGSKHEKIHFAPCGLRIQRFSILANQEAQTAKKSDFITCKKKKKSNLQRETNERGPAYTHLLLALWCAAHRRNRILSRILEKRTVLVHKVYWSELLLHKKTRMKHTRQRSNQKNVDGTGCAALAQHALFSECCPFQDHWIRSRT